jgi:NitT/TauT family transport system permease protein
MMASSKNIPGYVKEVKSVFHVRGGDAFKNVYLKALIPGIITGAITGIGAEWNASIVAEYFTTTGISGGSTLVTSVHLGLGKLLDVALTNGNLLLMGIALVNMSVIVVVINTLLWKRLYRNVSKVYK